MKSLTHAKMGVNTIYQAINKYFFSQSWCAFRRAVWLLALLLLARPATAQGADATLSVPVEPGDTWRALALRHDRTAAELRALDPLRAGALNPLREPAIGSSVRVPLDPPRSGRLLRPAGASPTLMALAHNVPLGTLLRANHLPPLYLTPHAALWLPAADGTVRDLPAGFTALALSHAQGMPGEAMALRAELAAGASVSVTLHTTTIEPLPFDLFRSAAGDRLVGLRGVGAFYPPGTQELTIAVAGAPLWSQAWQFAAGSWTFQTLRFSGAAAAIDQASIAAERARLFEIWSQASDQPGWSAEFATPIADYLAISSAYGTRRSYDGGATFNSYHEGVDFAAYGGTLVSASAAGRVVVAEPLYVRGGAVIIDHGLGIFSGYYHLSEVSATAERNVSAGQPIGAVGTTGLSTGNHLHWDLLVTETWVAADRWVERGMGCWLLAGLGTPCVLPQIDP